MKLKKREITLNEADSLKDVFFTENALMRAYEEGDSFAFRKETANALSALRERAQAEAERVRSLWRKAKNERL